MSASSSGLLTATVTSGADRAPVCFTNTQGYAPWSGKRSHTLSDSDIAAILDYCESDGYRCGWNDQLQGNWNPQARCPFHETFLTDTPRRRWLAHYLRGGGDQQGELTE
ncbi:MAG: hypothetical protein ABIW82_16915 [Dokdonella sp.]